MPKKRKTLPKNFNEMLQEYSIDKLKEVFNKCELNAYGGYNKQTALAFSMCPDELTYWLIEKGADINAYDGWKRTPLHSRAASRGANIKILIDLGAEINNNEPGNGTPLHFAIDSHNPENVKVLIEHGADLDVVNSEGFTPLEFGLFRSRNIDLINMSLISELMINAGVIYTPRCKEFVKKLGENFEFHRSNFNQDLVHDFDSALNKLYELFEVKPVPLRTIHDGKTTIKIKSKSWEKQFQELWDYLVPSQGSAKTIQGEIIRIAGRIADELEGNGGINWDKDYQKMSDMYLTFIKSGNSFSQNILDKISILIKAVKNKKEYSNYLSEMAVKWIIQNPEPMELPNISYKR